jgi:hypothetical protein
MAKNLFLLIHCDERLCMEYVTSVTPHDDFKLVLDFDNGETKVFDATPYLGKGVFKRLQDLELFKQAYVCGGTVCWPDGLDIAPETLFDRSLNIS